MWKRSRHLKKEKKRKLLWGVRSRLACGWVSLCAHVCNLFCILKNVDHICFTLAYIFFLLNLETFFNNQISQFNLFCTDIWTRQTWGMAFFWNKPQTVIWGTFLLFTNVSAGDFLLKCQTTVVTVLFLLIVADVYL